MGTANPAAAAAPADSVIEEIKPRHQAWAMCEITFHQGRHDHVADADARTDECGAREERTSLGDQSQEDSRGEHDHRPENRPLDAEPGRTPWRYGRDESEDEHREGR